MSLINQRTAPQADAFLNLKFVDANGVEYKLTKGLPLHEAKALEASIINAAKADPEFRLNLIGTVHVITEPTAADLPVWPATAPTPEVEAAS